MAMTFSLPRASESDPRVQNGAIPARWIGRSRLSAPTSPIACAPCAPLEGRHARSGFPFSRGLGSMKSFSLHGRNAVVTGGSRGIGRAIALRLAELGANVALTYRERIDDAHQVAREIEENGRLAVLLQMDVTDRASVDAAAKEARRALGPISLLINNAGINKLADFDPVTDGDGDAMLAATLKGPFRCAQAFLPLLAETKNGAIVHIGSLDSEVPTPAHYAASRAGLIALGEAIARFGAPLSVRSNVV